MAIAPSISKEFLRGTDIQAVFEVDQEGKPTGNARLLQDILKYCISEDRGENPFRFTDLARWLLSKNTEFFNFYANSHLSVTSRIQHIRQRVQRALDYLNNAGLVVVKGMIKAERNNQIETPVYDVTSRGLLVTWYIELSNDDIKRKNIATSNLIDILRSEFTKSDLAVSMLALKILDSIKNKLEQKLYRELIHFWVSFLLPYKINHPTSPVLGSFLLLLRGFHTAKVDSYSHLFIDAFQSLDDETKAMILFQVKCDLERHYVFFGNREWEKMRYQFRNDLQTAVVPMKCEQCGASQPLGIDISVFLGLSTKPALDHGIDEPVAEQCLKCGSKQTVVYNIDINRTFDNRIELS